MDRLHGPGKSARRWSASAVRAVATGTVSGGALAAAVVVGLPAAAGAGFRQVLLWTPDIG